uniref:Uncharacterized protein n=1 Tax=Avena sativa TaxID=4498 RepID=A0ACD5WXV3_AVESA
MHQVSTAAMKSGSGIEADDHIQEPVHVHGQREDSNAATFPSDGAPSAVAADASSQAQRPFPAAPVDRAQERGREQAGGGSRGTHGPSSAAAGVDQKLAAIPFLAPSPSSSVGSSPSTPSPDGASAFSAGTSSSAAGSGKGVKWRHPVVEGTVMVPKEARRPFQYKLVFEDLEREKAAINEADMRWAEEEEKKKKPEEEQVKSSYAKEALWSEFKNYFTRKKKIVDREGRQIYSEHVGHQEQVLDRQDRHEEHRLLDTVKRVYTQHANLGWTSKFSRSYREMHNCLTVVACHHSFTHCWHKLKFEVCCKVNNPILITMNLKINLLAK